MNEENEDTKVLCASCGEWIERDDAFEYDGCWYCSDCKSIHFRECHDCGEWHFKNEMSQVGNLWICSDCREHWIECEDCEEAINTHCNDVYDTVDGRTICHDCREANYFRCCCCDELYHNDDEHYVERTGSSYCPHCWNEEVHRDGLLEYHEFDTSLYRRRCLGSEDRDKMCMGVELECDEGEFDYEDFYNWTDDNTIHFEVDGSLSDEGVECITMPCTLGYHHANMRWDRLCEELKSQGFRSHDTDDCGLHVHMSRRALTPIQIVKMDVFINRAWRFFSEIARRRCFYNSDYETSKTADKCKGFLPSGYESHNARYAAVNTTNKDTVEIRIFRGTLNHETILGTIEMCHAMPRFLDTIPITKIYNTTDNVKKFIRFMAEDRHMYPCVLPMMRRLVHNPTYAGIVGELYGKYCKSEVTADDSER